MAAQEETAFILRKSLLLTTMFNLEMLLQFIEASIMQFFYHDNISNYAAVADSP